MVKTQYKVTWEIEVDAYSPIDAAKEAQSIMQDTNSTAQVLKVHNQDTGRVVQCDLWYKTSEPLSRPFVLVTTEGGVSSLHAKGLPAETEFVTVDYDTEGADDDELVPVTQSDGKLVMAFANHVEPDRPEISVAWRAKR